MKKSEHQLTLTQKLGYGCGDLAGSTAATISGFFANNFLLNVARVDPYFVGTIFLISKIWDGINDPIIGILTEKTHTRWGKRRPWLLFGAPGLGVAFIANWLVPNFGTDQQYAKVLYYLFAQLVLSFAFTAVNLPYCSLTANLTKSYDERTSLTTFRFGFSFIGSVISAVTVGALTSALGYRAGFALSAVIFAAIMCLSSWVTFASTRERVSTHEQPLHVLTAFKMMARNKPFLLVSAIYGLSWTTLQMVQSNLLFYAKFVVRAESKVPYILIGLLLVCIASVLSINNLSSRFDKKKVYYVGMSVWVGSQLGFTFFTPSNLVPLYILGPLVGVGLAVATLIPWSMLPDVIDYDELHSGRRSEGLYGATGPLSHLARYYSMFVFLQKAGVAFGIAFSNFALGFAGYVQPEKGQEVTQDDDVILPPTQCPYCAITDRRMHLRWFMAETPQKLYEMQPESVRWALRILMGPVPALLLLISFIAVHYYPITRERHAEILSQLEVCRHDDVLSDATQNVSGVNQVEDATPLRLEDGCKVDEQDGGVGQDGVELQVYPKTNLEGSFNTVA